MGQVTNKSLFCSRSQISKTDKSLLDLKTQRDNLKKHQIKMEKMIEKERQIAKELLKQQKKKQALLALKKKKYEEDLLEQTLNQIFNLEKLIDMIEYAEVQKQVVEALEIGNQTLKKIQKEYDLDRIEQLMEETQEAIEYQREVDAALSGCISPHDEEEIERELEQILKQQEDEHENVQEIKDEPIPLNLPSVPEEEPNVEEHNVEESIDEEPPQKNKAFEVVY